MNESAPLTETASAEAREASAGLPVAPRAFARSRFAGDAKPAQAMSPQDALAWLEAELVRGGRPGILRIDGPGDPLAVPAPVFETLALVRARLPEAVLEIATLGIGAGQLAGELAKAGLSRAEILMDALDPETYAALYAWIRPGVKNMALPEAAALLAAEQERAVTALTRAGVAVTVAFTAHPGVNDGQAASVAEKAAALGAKAMILRPFVPAPEVADEAPATPPAKAMLALRDAAGRHLPCEIRGPRGADAASVRAKAGLVPLSGAGPTRERPYVAVCSLGGMDVDQHLGHAAQYLIYGPVNDGPVQLIETRPAPEPGSGSARWEEGAAILHDCFALAAQSAGESPRKIYGRRGIRVLTSDGSIEGVVDALYGGTKGKKGGKGRKGRS